MAKKAEMVLWYKESSLTKHRSKHLVFHTIVGQLDWPFAPCVCNDHD